MRCSVFEEDEEVVGWKAGCSVAYCGPCFNDKMEREMKRAAGRQNATASASQAKEKEEAGESILIYQAGYCGKASIYK